MLCPVRLWLLHLLGCICSCMRCVLRACAVTYLLPNTAHTVGCSAHCCFDPCCNLRLFDSRLRHWVHSVLSQTAAPPPQTSRPAPRSFFLAPPNAHHPLAFLSLSSLLPALLPTIPNSCLRASLITSIFNSIPHHQYELHLYEHRGSPSLIHLLSERLLSFHPSSTLSAFVSS